MATGEYVSVSSQNELIQAEVRKEAHELKHNAESEQMELAASFRQQGVDADLADQVAAQISANPEHALGVHVREELGVDHHDLPSPYTAAGASLVTFAVGALIPLLPYLLGLDNLAVALGLAAVAAFVGGGLVARLTDRPFLRGALRQLILGAVAAGITFLIGSAVGAGVSYPVAAYGPPTHPVAAYGRHPIRRRPTARRPLPGVRPERVVLMPARPGQQLEVRLHHHRDQLVEADLGLPAEPPRGLGRVRAQLVHLGRADERRVHRDVVPPVQPGHGERLLDQLLHAVRHPGADHVVLGLVLAQHQVHGPDVVPGEPPVPARPQGAEPAAAARAPA